MVLVGTLYVSNLELDINLSKNDYIINKGGNDFELLW